MARHVFLSCLILLAVCLSTATAVDPAPAALLQRISAVRFEVAGGRITNPALSRAPSRTFTAEGAGRKEWLSINPTSDEPALSYRYKSPNQQWSLEFRGANTFTLHDKSDGESVVYQQLPNEPLRLTIERAGSPKRDMTARSLWHLLAFSPEASAYLLPRLEAVHPGWGLAKQAAEIKELAIANLDANWRQERVAWQRCVVQLGAADYQERQMADRRLRAGGSAAAAFLQTLERKRLEPEQTRRLARIVEAAARQPDEPSSIAAGWIYDTEVWCALLRDDATQRRTAAAAHLTEFLGRPLRFDPTADAPTRGMQVRAIEETLLRR